MTIAAMNAPDEHKVYLNHSMKAADEHKHNIRTNSIKAGNEHKVHLNKQHIAADGHIVHKKKQHKSWW